MDLFYPKLAVRLGSYTFNRGVSIRVCSSQDSYFDWATIRFTAQFEEQVKLTQLDPAEVLLGYDGSYNAVFKGFVTHDFTQAANGGEVLLKDATLKLASTEINHVFVAAQPAEIITYCCNQAGITRLLLPPTQYPQMTYPVIKTNALKAIQGISKQWGLSSRFYMLADTFCWNFPDEQKQLYQFEYQRNIISLSKEDGLWVLETVSFPFIRHSQKIAVQHPALSGTFVVLKVIFESNEAGFLRTRVYFKG